MSLSSPPISTTRFVSYTRGTIPLLISAPHGGDLHPESFPDRPSGNGSVTLNDLYTQEIALAIASELVERWPGAFPYVVVCRVGREKVDVNREKKDAGQGEKAQKVWEVSGKG